MYAVEVREHIMIAHSLPGDVFGPAQKLHGATYVVDVAFFRSVLDPDAIVVDIGRLHAVLKETLAPINYANLDELDAFKGVVTTTEYLARWIFDRLAEAAARGALGPNAGGLEKLRVTLNESHVAKAWYEGAL
ncbi:MAG: 6-carboxytetrahydropterin synthase [Pseudomonadota bacterium]